MGKDTAAHGEPAGGFSTDHTTNQTGARVQRCKMKDLFLFTYYLEGSGEGAIST